MKRFSEQLQKKANNIRLSTVEKDELRERLVSYMEYHPLPMALKENVVSPDKSELVSLRLVPLNFRRLLQMSGVALGMLVLSVSYFAERSVPGDSLYAVKVGFNEELRSSLARGSYEKVVWETERLNRRIAEARLLANEGRLTEEVEAEVASAVKEHSDNARREIEILKQTDKEEATFASLQLATALDVQSTAFQNKDGSEIGTEDDTKVEATSPIASAVAASKASEVASPEDTIPSYERLSAHVEIETTRAYELLKSVKKSATEEEQVDIQRRLEDIGRAITEANKLTEADELKARQGLFAVLQRTQKLIVFMTNIDIRSNVTVDQIVPVTPTIGERNQTVKTEIDFSLELLPVVEEVLGSSSASVRDKLVPALDRQAKVLADLKNRLPVDEVAIEEVERFVAEAKAVITDSAIFLKIDPKSKKKTGDQSIVSSEEVSGEGELSATTTSSSTEEATTATTTQPSATTTDVEHPN